MDRFTITFRKTSDGRFFCLAKKTPDEHLEDLFDESGNNLECWLNTPGECADLLYKKIKENA